jgi:hypothetical protein
VNLVPSKYEMSTSLRNATVMGPGANRDTISEVEWAKGKDRAVDRR